MASRERIAREREARSNLILDSAERLFVEKGYAETSINDIAEAADTTVIVLVPESGDSIQAMKAGLMEIGEIFVVNKADRDGADMSFSGLKTALRRARDDDMSWDGQGAFVEGPRRLFSGNGGLLSTAPDFARFLQMLVNEGVLDGERILAPASVRALSLNRVGDFYDGQR